MTLVFFNGQKARLEKLLPVGERRYISGKIELWDGRRQMVHPDRILDERGIENLPAVEAVYGLTEGLVLAHGRRAISARPSKGCPELPEWQDRRLARPQRASRLPAGALGASRPDNAAQLSEEALAKSAAAPAPRL